MFYFGEYFMRKYSVSNKPAALQQQVPHHVYEEVHLHGQHLLTAVRVLLYSLWLLLSGTWTSCLPAAVLAKVALNVAADLQSSMDSQSSWTSRQRNMVHSTELQQWCTWAGSPLVVGWLLDIRCTCQNWAGLVCSDGRELNIVTVWQISVNSQHCIQSCLSTTHVLLHKKWLSWLKSSTWDKNIPARKYFCFIGGL